jgi:DNA-binding transcriptional regulator YiaG
MSGLENVWLLNGFAVEQTPYGDGVRVEDADGLHRALARVIASDKTPMSGRELRFLRKLMGMSQGGLARLIGSSDQRVARWEKGQAIDPTAERLIRAMVRQFLGDDCNLRAALEELAEMDEEMHGQRTLVREGESWKRAA